MAQQEEFTLSFSEREAMQKALAEEVGEAKGYLHQIFRKWVVDHPDVVSKMKLL